MAMARAFAQGPRPKRSLLFVWHAGEERGPLGVAVLRRPSDRAARSHRRAAEHRHGRPQPRRQGQRGEHGLSGRLRSHQHRARPGRRRPPTGALAKPLKLDYEMNDPSDPEQVYTRSDHYSYASRGHSDHLLHDRPAPRLPREHRRRVEDRVRQDDAGRRVRSTRPRGASANLDHAPVRDRKGPTGREGPSTR